MLNPKQSHAVNYMHDVPLQIIAGPGSGKTKVLTARIARLVQQEGMLPSQICAVTFTNKAANEMKARLGKLIGTKNTENLVIGTFHALCAKLLRQYGASLSLPRNFTICDTDESKRILAKIMKDYEAELDSKMKIMDVLAFISKAKAKGLSALQAISDTKTSDKMKRILASVYIDHDHCLRKNNALDFDDLLMFGVRLFNAERKAVSWCRHVLVDEFQDTNSMQYEIMHCLASLHKCVTIVGDPDQSIYGWRSADVTNLGRMHKDFPGTAQIFLEENYRSTGSILKISLAIISQDKSRIAKSLRTSQHSGTLPTLQTYTNDQEEANFIAHEIKRLIAHSGALLTLNDFVILLRFNALSPIFEKALQKEGIPSRVLAGQKFFERLEIKDLIAYLQLIDNPDFMPAFIRASHAPPKGIGEKSIAELTAKAMRLGTSPMALAERIYKGNNSDIKPPVRRKLEALVKPILKLRKMANEGTPVADLIRHLLALINYEDHLRKSKDWESRWQNVQELISFAAQSDDAEPPFKPRSGYVSNLVPDRATHKNKVEIISLISDDESGGMETATTEGDNWKTPLKRFLDTSMLSTDAVSRQEEQTKDMVTLATCHSAKGLEWPVVFIPAVEQGIYPSYKAEDDDEERRLLYVACTRAQGLLYLSHSIYRMTAGERLKNKPSSFISNLSRTLFSPGLPTLTPDNRHGLASLLRREPVDECIVQQKILEHTMELQQSNMYISTQPVVSGCSDGHPVAGSAQSSHLPPSLVPVNALPSVTFTSATGKHLPTQRPAPSYENKVSNSHLDVTPEVPLVFFCSEAPTAVTNTFMNQEGNDGASTVNKLKRAPTSTSSTCGTRRRLGMGRPGSGYNPNKKLKTL